MPTRRAIWNLLAYQSLKQDWRTGKHLKNHFAWAKMHALFPEHSAGVRVHLGLQWGPSSLGGRSCSKGQRGWRRRLPGARRAARLCREAGCQDPEPAGFLRAPVILPFAQRRLLPPPLSAFPPRGSPGCFSHWQMPAAFLPAVGGAGGGRASASASSALAASCIPGISQLQVL